MEGVIRAKTELWRRLRPGGLAVVNLDDEVLKKAALDIPGEKLTFGTAGKNPGADVLLRRAEPDSEGGTHLVLEAGGKVCETVLTALGRFQGLNVVAAAAGAYALGAGLDEICNGLAGFRSIDHRMRLVRGVGGTTLLDDAYNANPVAMAEALATLIQIAPPGSRRVAVLGQMAELGEAASGAHRDLGRRAAAQGLELLIALGPLAGTVVEEALRAGLKEAFAAEGIEEAADMVGRLGRPNDFILIKGSRVAGLERLVALLAGDE